MFSTWSCPSILLERIFMFVHETACKQLHHVNLFSLRRPICTLALHASPTSQRHSRLTQQPAFGRRACRRGAYSQKAAAASSASKGAMAIITFDVDGTLLTSTGPDANKLHKLAFAHAMKTTFDVDTNIDVIKHHGSTDPLILLAVLEHHGVSREESLPRLQEMESAMNAFFESHKASAGAGLVLLPGVHNLLSALKGRQDVAVGLVTGNLEPIGWGKMEALGLLSLFSKPQFGGFGSDFCSGNIEQSWKDRGELVRIAAKRAEESHGAKGPRFHVGDTPMDIQAAADAGAQAVGVLTGIYSREELLKPGIDTIILDDLSSLEDSLAAFGLDPQQ